MTSTFTSFLNDSYVDYADAEKSLNVANETEIVTKNSSRWIQKAPTVYQRQSVSFSRRSGHDSTSTNNYANKKTRGPVLYPVKKMLVQQGERYSKATEPTGDITCSTRLLSTPQTIMKELGRICPVFSSKSLTLSRPNGTAINLQTPNGTRASTPLLCSSDGKSLRTKVLSTLPPSNSSTFLNTEQNVTLSNVIMKPVAQQNTMLRREFSATQQPLREQRRNGRTISSESSRATLASRAFCSVSNMRQTANNYSQNSVQMRDAYAPVPKSLQSSRATSLSSNAFCSFAKMRQTTNGYNLNDLYPPGSISLESSRATSVSSDTFCSVSNMGPTTNDYSQNGVPMRDPYHQGLISLGGSKTTSLLPNEFCSFSKMGQSTNDYSQNGVQMRNLYPPGTISLDSSRATSASSNAFCSFSNIRQATNDYNQNDVYPPGQMSLESSNAASMSSVAFCPFSKMGQTTNGYNQNGMPIYQDQCSPVSSQFNTAVALTPPPSLSGQPSPNQQCYDINAEQRGVPLLPTHCPYAVMVTPPTDKCTMQENEIDYSLLDEFFIRT